MKALFYWLIASALLAVVVHLFIVIFVPGVDTGQKMAQFTSAAAVNEFHQIDRVSPQTLLNEADPDLAYAFCTYDISDKALEIEAHIPPTYWSVSIYTNTADNIYTLNDTQAGVETIKLLLARDGEEVDLANGIGQRDENTILIRSPSTEGLILFRAYIGDGSLDRRVRSYYAESGCSSREAVVEHGPVLGQIDG